MQVPRALGRRKGFSPRMPPFTMPSMSTPTSLQRGRTEPFVLRRWKRGALLPRPPKLYEMQVCRVIFSTV
jgi:hypothetical protein